jgi:hypothetical protein
LAVGVKNGLFVKKDIGGIYNTLRGTVCLVLVKSEDLKIDFALLSHLKPTSNT